MNGFEQSRVQEEVTHAMELTSSPLLMARYLARIGSGPWVGKKTGMVFRS